MRRIVLASCALLLSACSTSASLDELRQTNPTGNAFQKELAAMYLGFAEQEAENYDWYASQYFAKKGLQSAYGRSVEPEDPANWKIAEGHMPELRKARTMLTQKIDTDNMAQRPKELAEAIYFFDCWVEELEENWQTSYIDSCREQFYGTLENLSSSTKTAAAHKPASAGTKVTPALASYDAMPEEALDDDPFSASSFLVFFDVGKIQMNAKSDAVLRRLVANLESFSDYDIIVNGHTDRAGKAEFNHNLALHRAERVKKALVALGVDSDSISVFSFGESDPRIPTADSVREPGNRRVEIFLTG